jgi:hypothetical protein
VKPFPPLHGHLEWHKQYDNIDGTGEMLMGLMLLGFGLLGYLQSILPKDSIWTKNFFFSLLFMYAVLFVVIGPGYWIRRVIKRRITFPRTGYVASHSLWRPMVAPKTDDAGVAPGVPTRKSLWFTMLGIVLLAALVGGGLVCMMVLFERRHLDAMMWLVGVGYVGYLGFWVLVYAFWIWRMGREQRWKWLVLLFMALGLLVIGLLGPGNYIEVVRPVMLFVGVVWIISGLATLFSYLRHTRAFAGEAQ